MESTRRDMLQTTGKLLMLASAGATFEQVTGAQPGSRLDLFASAGPPFDQGTVHEPAPDPYKMADHWWGMIIDIDKCIGCGNCVRACADENGVPKGYYRTWVERYEVPEGHANPH